MGFGAGHHCSLVLVSSKEASVSNPNRRRINTDSSNKSKQYCYLSSFCRCVAEGAVKNKNSEVSIHKQLSCSAAVLTPHSTEAVQLLEVLLLAHWYRTERQQS
jgi:hypothetical protein